MSTTSPYWDGQHWLHWDGQQWLTWDGSAWLHWDGSGWTAAPAAAGPPPAPPPAPPVAAPEPSPPTAAPPAPPPVAAVPVPPPSAPAPAATPAAIPAAPAQPSHGGRIAALVAGAVALLLVVGVGAYVVGSRTGDSTTTGGATASAGPTANGVQDGTAEQILAAAKAAALAQSSVHLRTVASDSATFDVTVVKDVGGFGSITSDGTTMELVRTPQTLYMKAPATEWESRLNAAAAGVIGTKWVAIGSSDSSYSDLGDVLAYSDMLGDLLTPDTAITKGQTATFDGAPAVGLVSSDGTMWVATTGQPLPLGIEVGSTGNKATFSEWGAAVTLPVPAADQVISIEEVKAQAGG